MKKIEELNCGDKVIYKDIEREVYCINQIENLIGLKPTWEPEDIVWVRFESLYYSN